MFFSLCREREGTKRELVARFVPEGISTLRTELRDSLRSNRSSLLLRSRSQSLHSLASTFAIATIYGQGAACLLSPLQLPQGGRDLCYLTFVFCPHRGLDPHRGLNHLIADLIRDLLQISTQRYRDTEIIIRRKLCYSVSLC